MALAGLIDTTILFAAVLGVMHVVFTLRVGFYRKNSRISFGDGGDGELLKRIRAHGNFIENARIALVLLMLNEMDGMANEYLLAIGCTFILARLVHYAALAFSLPVILRMLSMVLTMLSILVLAVRLAL